MNKASTFQLVDLREGGDVRSAAVLEKSEGKLRVQLADGRELRLPVARVLDRGGEISVSGKVDNEAISAAVAEWEREAEGRGAGVDLEELHGLLAAECGAGAVVELAAVAPLVLGDALPSSRAAVHRALARSNPWFRFDGKRWLVRAQEDVEKDLAKQAEQQRLASERSDFVASARRILAGEKLSLPEGAEKFLRPLRDIAVQGESAGSRKEAGQLVADIRGGSPGNLSAGAAFDVMVRLRQFSPHENLDLLRAGVSREFPPEVLEEAERLALKPVELGPGRLDLRALEIVTIDDEGTTEIDDGLSFVEGPRGFQLGIHIADASYFIEAGSLVDREALARSTTYYLPGLSIPMLPSSLSEQAASLNEGEDRPALSFLIEFTPHGELLSSRLSPSLVRVARRMSYEDCESVLAGVAAKDEQARWSFLRRIDALALKLEADRIAAGSTPIRAQEIRIELSPSGEPSIELLDPGRPARKLVSEMMILANSLAAKACAERDALAIFRQQAPPNGGLPAPPTDHYDPVLVNAFRRTLQRTVVTLEPGPHAGLGLEAYLQATSPIRRYQDLVVHRIIKAFLAGEPKPYDRTQLQAIADSSEAAGRQARAIENATDEYFILRSYENRIGELLEAVVLRSDKRRTDVELLDSAHRVAIPSREGHYPGDRLRLMIRAADARGRTLSLEEVRGR